ncbi:MAG TPA: methionine--tRNA ligase [bacterium]|nr:methionine--tRNA ligase [bacterium]
MSKKYYITTPIYYVNDVPHIGHAYTTIAADVLARFHKTKGEDVFFLTGTDEHGAKIAEAASKAGKEPKDFVDELAPKFQETWKKLNIEYSEFFRTTNPEHEKLVQEFMQKVKDNGYIEKRSYSGLYCISCERYYKPEELIDGKLCPDHKRDCVEQTEENYFFLLSKFGDQLIKKIENGEFEIGPESRKNEIISKIKLGLEDVSVSRANVKWGIPFPGDQEQTIYVWFDALLNYWTAGKIYFPQMDDGRPNNEQQTEQSQNTKYEIRNTSLWPADLHLMAKDILWFHAVIWPAMLIAAGEEAPKKVFAHGFFTINGQKMSKTLGNVIDPNDVVDKFGADAVRYALLREFPFGEDGDISLERIRKRYDEELSNTLGNLLQRTLVMIKKYCAQEFSNYQFPSASWRINQSSITQFQKQVSSEINNLQFSRALEKVMEFTGSLNQLINEKAPWVLAKEGKDEEAAAVLSQVFAGIVEIAESLVPFMPETAGKMKKQLETLEPEPLFPRLES